MSTVIGELLDELTRRLVEAFQPEEIILFGSHAWGSPDRGSDIDVMVIVATSDLSEYERTVAAHRCLSGLAIAKDVIVRTRAEFDDLCTVRGSLEDKIASQGEVLYDRRQEAPPPQLANEARFGG